MAVTLPKAIVDLSDDIESDNLMIYGDTGSGKSVLIGQLYWYLEATDTMCLIISNEAGVFVAFTFLRDMGISERDIKKRFKVWRVRKWQDYEDAYTWVRDHPMVFKWVAHDSATSLQQRAMRLAMEIAVKRNPDKRDIDLPDKGEHQKMQNAMKRMITDWNELPENCLWLANAMRREDEEGEDIVLPFIMGKGYDLSVWSAAQVNACIYYAKEKVKGSDAVRRRLWFDSPPPYWTKDRYGIWGPSRVMALGSEQRTSLSRLIEELDANPEARKLARRRVAEQDDSLTTKEGTTRTTKKTAKKTVKKVAASKSTTPGRKFRPTTEED